MHLHDTYGRAVPNVLAAHEYGVEVSDTAAGGLGGCPYAPGAAGNVATEALARHLAAQGFDHGLDMAVMNHIGTPEGFPLKDNWWLSTVLHDKLRLVAQLLFVVLLGIWVLYRIIRGWIALTNGRPMPLPVSL